MKRKTCLCRNIKKQVTKKDYAVTLLAHSVVLVPVKNTLINYSVLSLFVFFLHHLSSKLTCFYVTFLCIVLSVPLNALADTNSCRELTCSDRQTYVKSCDQMLLFQEKG